MKYVVVLPGGYDERATSPSCVGLFFYGYGGERRRGEGVMGAAKRPRRVEIAALASSHGARAVERS